MKGRERKKNEYNKRHTPTYYAARAEGGEKKAGLFIIWWMVINYIHVYVCGIYIVGGATRHLVIGLQQGGFPPYYHAQTQHGLGIMRKKRSEGGYLIKRASFFPSRSPI